MDDKDAKKVRKYMTLYMSLGMCFGVAGGLIYGMILLPDQMALGICFGIPIGMCIGMVIGATKDKKLAEQMMTITRIEAIPDSSDVSLYATDKDGVEKEYRVPESKMKEEKLSIGDRVAEESEGSLVSLESK